MNLPTTFNKRPITACWVFQVRVHTSSKKRTSWTTYEISAINETLAIYEAKSRSKNRDIITIDQPILVNISYAYYTDIPELPWLESDEKIQLFKSAKTHTIIPTN